MRIYDDLAKFKRKKRPSDDVSSSNSKRATLGENQITTKAIAAEGKWPESDQDVILTSETIHDARSETKERGNIAINNVSKSHTSHDTLIIAISKANVAEGS